MNHPVNVPPPVNAGRDTKARAAARQKLVDVLWDERGARRLPAERALVSAMTACDPRDVWWVCEASSAGPLYLLPTREWIAALATLLDLHDVENVLEIAAGDGFLTACLRAARPGLNMTATDDTSWSTASARMNRSDRNEFKGVSFTGIQSGAHVVKMDALKAVRKFKPDLVLVSWPPPGPLVDKIIKAPTRLVLDISVDGDVCGNGMRTWRFNKEFLEGPIEKRALCRLDARPSKERHTRVTLYYGAQHPDFDEEKFGR